MRQFLTLLLSLIIGMWTSTANAETVQQQLERYKAATEGSIVRLHAYRSPQRYLSVSGESLYMPVPSGKSDPRQLWVIKAEGAGFTLQNVLTGGYVKLVTDANRPQISGDKATLYIRANTISGKNGKYVNLSSRSDFSGKSMFAMNAQDNDELFMWTLDDGSIWAIEDAETAEPVEPEEGKTFYLRSLVYDRYVGESPANEIITTTKPGNNIFPVFSFEKSGENYLIKNIVTNRYIKSPGGLGQVYTTTDKKAGATQFSAERQPNQGIFFRQKGTDYGMHVSQSQSYTVVTWGNCNASNLFLEPKEITDEEIEEMRDIYDACKRMASIKASDFTGMFANKQATELTDQYKGLSDEDFLATPKVSALPESIQSWLLKLKNDKWDAFEKLFRIHDYEAVSDNNYWAGKLNIVAYSPMYNPTGITLQNGEVAIIFVGTLPILNKPKELTVEGHTSWQDHSGQKQMTLKEGFNLFVANADNMQLYINYKSKDNAELSKFRNIPIQIVGGKVNGYFDARNWTDAEWVAMKKAGLFSDPILDVVGHSVQWRVKAGDVLPGLTKPATVMKHWDRLIGLELSLMGLTECPEELKGIGGEEVYEDLYPKKFNNRMLCFYNGNGGNPYSTYACTYYTDTWNFSDNVVDPDRFELWVGGHEIGHNNQSAINLAACTEVSNNLFSGMVAHEFGKVGRSVSMGKLQERMASGNNLWLDNMGDVFHLNHMYYSLYLYYHAAGHNPLFWPKMFNLLRKDPLQNHGGQHVTADKDYLKFALKACEAAGENLTEYFTAWGFFIPFSGEKEVADYSSTFISVTPSMIDNVKAQMAKYPKANSAIMFIDDFKEYNEGKRGTLDWDRSEWKKNYIFGDYQSFVSKQPTQPNNFLATYTKSTGSLVLPASTAWNEAAGIKVYDSDGNLIYIGNTRKMTIPASLRSKVAYFKLSLPDGTDIPLYTRVDVQQDKAVKMTVYNSRRPNGTVRYTNGSDEAMRSDMRDGANALAMVEGTNLDTAAPAMRTAKNVIVEESTENRTAADIELTDGEDLVVPVAFQAAKASYSRSETGGKYNTVVLPFDMPKSAFGQGAIVEDVDRVEEAGGELKVYFKAVTDEVIQAGRPVVVYTPAEVSEWTAADTRQENVTVTPTMLNGTGDASLAGSYLRQTIGEGKFKLNTDGTLQEKSDATTGIEPFRAYLQFATAPEASVISLIHANGDVTGIEDINDDVLSAVAPMYDMQGRRIEKPISRGIYIRNGKKVIIR